jgi:hypothetical protein
MFFYFKFDVFSDFLLCFKVVSFGRSNYFYSSYSQNSKQFYFVSPTWHHKGQITKAAAVISTYSYSKYDSHITVQVIMAIRSVMLQFVITDV